MELLSIVLGILGGASAAVTGLIAYFGNLRMEKFKADLAETNTKLKAALDSSIRLPLCCRMMAPTHSTGPAREAAQTSEFKR